MIIGLVLFMIRKKRNEDDCERLLKKNENPPFSSPRIPERAKHSIVLAFVIIFIGLLCSYLFIATFFSNTIISKTEGRWAYFIFAILTIPSGSYTLYVAFQVYHRNPEYNWPMIYF